MFSDFWLLYDLSVGNQSDIHPSISVQGNSNAAIHQIVFNLAFLGNRSYSPLGFKNENI